MSRIPRPEPLMIDGRILADCSEYGDGRSRSIWINPCQPKMLAREVTSWMVLAVAWVNDLRAGKAKEAKPEENPEEKPESADTLNMISAANIRFAQAFFSVAATEASAISTAAATAKAKAFSAGNSLCALLNQGTNATAESSAAIVEAAEQAISEAFLAVSRAEEKSSLLMRLMAQCSENCDQSARQIERNSR